MKKRNVRTLDGIIYSLFIFMTIATLFVIYRDIPSKATLNFVTAYAIFAIFIPLYILIRVLFTVKHFTFEEVKKEGVKFLMFFIGIMMLRFIGDFFLPLPDLKLSKTLPSSLIFAFGITCFDIVLSKRPK
ncbi:TPA: hypothetical protein I9059_001944 [Clostridium perfringens]|uniref:hypothetical protein n=1 Tax=Clostridium perfringens TaxID=1502 RepID=UPI001A18E18B|nr:hypothetical protein [Clostridium perfringens]MCI2780174.1 hypothetical protein [Clostridium perfringens]MDK0698607.1 hypothetical protein [Clostridium perfringens]MDM0475621.1 hypothetical protein [Clostridium perfringens]HAT4246766.1 hypothetical protein [Clostridium perfringens]